MSALAKFFVVFNLVLSLFFFGASATLYLTRYNWREAHESYKETARVELQKLNEQVTRVSSRNDQLKSDNLQFKADLDASGVRIRRLDEQVADASKKIGLAEAARSQSEVTMAEQSKLLKAEVERNDSLSQQLTKAGDERKQALDTAEAASAEANSLKLDLAKAQEELSSLRIAVTEADQNLEECRLTLAMAEKRLGGKVVGKPAPDIEGQIVAVDTAQRLVVLSVGADDLVEKGHEFTVFRGDNFVGKVQVFQVYPDLAGARILFTKDGSEVEQGDRASTVLN